ncbi:VWA domain-containing protein [Poseidonocella sp. HB161398]|uniref:VWA domain-containing protein n=1 Tax=Poseidonocella sp. HB161398 TaxID=2320855 RepID=UPI0011098EE5|nr:VWA domain-containing protein [Poseidonocella sp. HB161398]
MTVPELILLRPLWLAGLPLALAAAVLARRHAGGLAAWRRVADPALLEAMRRRGHVTPSHSGAEPWLAALALALLCAGLAGPADRDPDAPVLRDRHLLLVLLDLSPSVTRGGGLDDAQAAVSRLVDIGGTRPTGLIVYAGESFLAALPTEDPGAVQGMIAVADGETMPVGGSRPDRALAMAQRVLRDAAAPEADVVLVSDGGGMGPEALGIARQMAEEGSRISAVFVPQGAPQYGLPPGDPEGLEAVARAGGGRMADAGAAGTVDALLPVRRGTGARGTELRALQYRDRGPWLAAAALVPLALLFRRRRA